MLANVTSLSWLCVYHGVLPKPKAQAASQLQTFDSNATADIDQTAQHEGDLSADPQDPERLQTHTAQVTSTVLGHTHATYAALVVYAAPVMHAAPLLHAAPVWYAALVLSA